MASEGAHLEVEMSTESMLDDQYTAEDEIIGYVEPWIASPGQTVEVKECLSDPFINTTANMVPLSYDGISYKTWATYDFALDIPTDRITDTSGGAHHGVLINAPTRAVKDHTWDGVEPDWTKAKYGYGAIHFHEDDLDDAMWPTDFTVTIPEDATSGAYAVVVTGMDPEHRHVSDSITFFVRPSARSLDSRPRTAIVLSTFTYLAYANEHMYDQSRASRMELSGGVRIRKDANWRRMARRADLGCSLYDVHRDGSSAAFTSSRRPILNIRPDYINWAFHRPREFSADQFMIGFLEQRLGRRGYDVLTDHDLHLHGEAALAGYSVVVTGCHPEYPSLEILNAYHAFATRGGSIMYLGGNGFYWCAVVDPTRPHRMEVRKGDQGCRSTEQPAGERVHALNGAQGGLWRARGRTPQSLFGIGSCACGNGLGVPYRFSDDIVASADFAWLFEGLTRDEAGNLALLGMEGFGGGASGDEIDRLDFALGTPSNTVLLASSTGHDDSFGLFNEEIMFPMVNTVGSTCAKIRSDMTLYRTSGGGFVFSVGSINWYCSLGWNGYDNDVARLTWNVLKKLSPPAEGLGGVISRSTTGTDGQYAER
ncbi:large subunit of -dimethylformamidase protein [Purpureocillium lavendulum]|uniref:Large subunit of -dimethylformamidase protein n=1 Tax=Purpureocillium lavendulum TaxID=1247861 RepID=A0AB34FZ06_9HYPO|nr:large subunit of -dimethylformamidase protein [Purpureocillium lavendulum]